MVSPAPIRILLVRAVNVGGTGKLPMARFREVLEELGATEVRTYIASGNAVARVPGDASDFERRVEAALTAEFGWERDVISRTPEELRAALAAHPFEVIEPKRSYLAPLTAKPAAADVRAAADIPSGADEWDVVGADLHLRYANGAGRADLDLGRLLRRLGVQGTARNVRTVEKLLALAEE